MTTVRRLGSSVRAPHERPTKHGGLRPRHGTGVTGGGGHMSRSRAKGTSWEQAIADYLRERGWPHAERRAMNGANDRGDITGLPLVVIEAKNAQTWCVPEWLREAELERARDGADLGVVWIKRRMSTSPGAAYVVMDGHTFTELLKKAGY